MRVCNEYNDKNFCDECINQYNEKNDSEANLNELKRPALIEFGHMLSDIKEKLFCQLFVLVHLKYTLFFLLFFYIR